MKNNLEFLIKVQKLKEIPRTGWVVRGVKNPETIAEHTFRVAFAACLLGKKENLNVKKLIKLALCHDICEVYAGDNTPFFYYQNLKKEKRGKILKKWVRLSIADKEKLSKIKFIKERDSLLKLISFLSPELKNEIFSLWLDYEKRISREGKFVKQIDKIEPLLQALEYKDLKEEIGEVAWWEDIEETVEDRSLLKLLKVIQNKFYQRKFPRDKKLENILDFLLEIGKLKRMPRLYWKLRGIKNPETIAGHIFTLALMALVFGREKKQLNMGKLLKMALCHEITAVHTGDTVPYYITLPKNKKERSKILKKLPRLLKEKKTKKFLEDYKKEKNALEKVISKLNPAFKKEIIQLWEEYRNRSSPEGYFLSQLNVLAVLLQALLYRKKRKNFSVHAIWEWAFEICDDPIVLKLMKEMQERLYKAK